MKISDYSIDIKDTNVLKGIAIIAMLVHHLFFHHPEYGNIVYHLGKIGKVCVALFLFLSGYGLTVQYSNTLKTTEINRGGVILKFLFKRFLKFYINYWFIFVIAVFIGIFAYGRGPEIAYGADKNSTIMLLRDFFGLNGMESYNVTWWFNKLILTLYLAFPLLYILTRNRFVGLLVLVISYYYISYFPFILGMMIATNMDLINKILSGISAKVVLAVSILAVLGLCVVRQMSTLPFMHGVYMDGIVAPFMALVIVASSRLGGLEFKALHFLGVHSMNMYMTHTFIYYYFHPEFIYGFKYPLFIFCALLISSLVLSILIEKIKNFVGLYQAQHFLIKQTI